MENAGILYVSQVFQTEKLRQKIQLFAADELCGVALGFLFPGGCYLLLNANKYTWVWKKSTESSRYKLFGKITALLAGINKSLMHVGLHIETNAEYTPEYLDEITKKYKDTSNQRILTVKVSVKSL